MKVYSTAEPLVYHSHNLLSYYDPPKDSQRTHSYLDIENQTFHTYIYKFIPPIEAWPGKAFSLNMPWKVVLSVACNPASVSTPYFVWLHRYWLF